MTGKGREGVEEIEDEALRYIAKRCICMEKKERYRDAYALKSDLQVGMVSAGTEEKAGSKSIWNNFLLSIDEDYGIDYSGTFLQRKDSLKVPITPVLVISLFVMIVLENLLSSILTGWELLLYIPYTIILGGYFKSKLQKLRFFYPYSQDFIEIREKLYMNLLVNRIKFEAIDACHMQVSIKNNTYLVTADSKEQVITIRSQTFRLGIRNVYRMMEDFGVIVYLFQHVHAI
jgi:hypothetical protein